jgi:hypothetical protein
MHPSRFHTIALRIRFCSISKRALPPHLDVPNNQPQTAWGMLVVMVFIYAVGLAGTALQAFNTVQHLHIADAVKLGDEN